MKHLKLLTIMLLFAVFAFTGYAQEARNDVEQTYLSQVGVLEATGHNDGVEVANYLESTGLGEGYAWCAAFVNWTYVQHDVDVPARAPAWSPSWFPPERVYSDITNGGSTPQKGDVFGLYFKSKQRIAHVGFIHKWPQNANYCITVEGNTNKAGSRDGDGVYKKRRLKRQIYKVSNWIGYNSLHGDRFKHQRLQTLYPIKIFYSNVA
ncbi:MAG: CHAP domain-containing protein [Salinivirgaceae bacterium]|jgi:hypothetical protein|nr:CHAP domain-containing protein [Salinivirgaceae bacterium]